MWIWPSGSLMTHSFISEWATQIHHCLTHKSSKSDWFWWPGNLPHPLWPWARPFLPRLRPFLNPHPHRNPWLQLRNRGRKWAEEEEPPITICLTIFQNCNELWQLPILIPIRLPEQLYLNNHQAALLALIIKIIQRKVKRSCVPDVDRSCHLVAWCRLAWEMSRNPAKLLASDAVKNWPQSAFFQCVWLKIQEFDWTKTNRLCSYLAYKENIKSFLQAPMKQVAILRKKTDQTFLTLPEWKWKSELKQKWDRKSVLHYFLLNLLMLYIIYNYSPHYNVPKVSLCLKRTKQESVLPLWDYLKNYFCT